MPSIHKQKTFHSDAPSCYPHGCRLPTSPNDNLPRIRPMFHLPSYGRYCNHSNFRIRRSGYCHFCVSHYVRHFQASEQQRLAHAIQICAQRIHQHHTVRNRVSGKIVIVGRACQRVIQDLVETATAKLFGNQVLQFITAVSRSLIAQIRLYIVTEFHIIISVNTENILDHVDIALYINTIYRHVITKPSAVSKRSSFPSFPECLTVSTGITLPINVVTLS